MTITQPNITNARHLFSHLTAVLLFSALTMPLSAYGQSLPILDFTGKPGEKRPELLDPKAKTAPDSPLTLPAPLPTVKEKARDLIKGVMVRKIVVTGSTVFSTEELAKVTTPYENRTVTMENLESLRRDLTLLYVNRGYINSGAVIPDQNVVDGTVALRIVEGKLSQVTIQGRKWFSDSFLQKRIELGAQQPLNIGPLQERLQLLQQDPRIQGVHAELRPGAKLGEADLTVKVDERPPISVWVAFNNYQSPSVGAERGITTITHQNLTGHGDVASFTYGFSDGLDALLDTWYALPVNAWDTTLMFRYRKSDSKVVEKTFAPLDIVSKSEAFEFSIRQPVYRTLSQELSLVLGIERERTSTSLLGEPFSFSPGVENGKSIVVPLRFAQEWTYRTQRQVLTARSRFSFGLNAWDATVHSKSEGPDGKFFAWLGQAQWAQITSFLDTQLIARADVQQAAQSLLPVEQMAVGGRYTVRGYRENLLVRDRAFITSLEARLPLVQNQLWADYLQLCPFIDYGSGSNVDVATVGPKDISSIGAGLRWGASLVKAPFDLKADAEIYWGHQLRDLPHNPHYNLQDDGIHLQVGITALF